MDNSVKTISKKRDPRMVASEVSAKLEDIEAIIVTAKFKDGRVATIKSDCPPNDLALMSLTQTRNINEQLFEPERKFK